jgi:hypothetical protein
MYTVCIVNNFNNYNYKYDDLYSNDWGWYIDTEIMAENVTTNLENNFNYTKKTKKANKINKINKTNKTTKINELYTIIEEDYEYYMYDDNEIENETNIDIANNKNTDIDIDNEYFRYSISQKNRYELYNKILNVCCIVMLYSLITHYIWCII